MKRWFESLPIHRKLVTLVLGVSTAALLAAVAGLLAFDIARFRASAVDDAHAAAQMIADNSAAAIVFDDGAAARQTLASVRVRPVVVTACVYRQDGSVLAAYERYDFPEIVQRVQNFCTNEMGSLYLDITKDRDRKSTRLNSSH